MRYLAAIIFVTACTSNGDVSPGTPTISAAGSTWSVGQPGHLDVEWPAITECGPNDWDCNAPALTLLVDSVTCHGCQVVNDPSGTETGGGLDLVVIPEQDGDESVSVAMTFIPTGDQATVSAVVSASAN